MLTQTHFTNQCEMMQAFIQGVKKKITAVQYFSEKPALCWFFFFFLNLKKNFFKDFKLTL